MGTYQKNCDFRPGLACGFSSRMLAGFFPFAAASEELPQNIVRLHVVANSDSEEDQAVKLLVRDAVLEEAARWYGDARTMEEASARLCTHLESIAKTSQATLREQGMGYSATAQVTEMYFPTRDYESFRLPAGRYRTLRVTLGEGAGKNWWCVVFPSLCLPAASGRGGSCSPCRRSSGGWWRTLSNARSSSRPWSCGRPCGNGCGADGAFSRQGDVV